MTFDCTSMITLWRLDFTSPLYAGKYQTRTRRVMVQQEEYTRLQCNARYSVLVINYFYLQNYKCMKYKRCLLRYSGTRVHTSFYSMKGQRAFLLSPGWYASSLQDKEWECFFFFATVEPPAPVINFSYIPFKLINLRETKDFIHVIKVQLLYNMQLRFCVGSIINRFQLKDLSRCKILESLEMKI